MFVVRVHGKETAEEAVRHAVITGDYEAAVDCPLLKGHMADALLFAQYAQDEVLSALVSRRYLEQHASAMARSFGLVAAGEWAQLVSRRR